MRFALARKELRDLRAFVWLAGLFCIVEIADATLRQTDHIPLSAGTDLFEGPMRVLQLLLSFAIGTGLLVREQDDGTLNFLDGLPLTRNRMFVTKLLTAFAVMMLIPSLQVLIAIGSHLLSRDSLSFEVHPSLLFTAWRLQAVATGFGLSLGMMLGYLRNLAWAFAATLATGLGLLGRDIPRALLLDPTALGEGGLVGNQWPLSIEAVSAQLGMSALFVLISWRAFATGKSGTKLAQTLARPLVSVVVGMATIGAVIAVVAVQNQSATKPTVTADLEIKGADFGQRPLSHLATDHYTFAFAGHSAKVLAASKRADAIFLEIAEDLPTDVTVPIDVDLTGSMTNTAGTAFWNKIRIAPDTPDLVAVLAHETTHVLARRLLKDDGRDELGRMDMFNEGLAQWVEYRYAPPTHRDDDRLLAAVVFFRREIAVEDLFDFSRFTRAHDRSLVYPLGAAFIEALVGRYGNDAPARVLSALSKKDFPGGLSGHALWQTAFQLAGLDLSLVIDDFWKLLGGWAKESKQQAAALPRLRGIVEAGSTKLDMRVATDKALPEGWRTVVRFRPTPTAALSEFTTVEVKDDRARRQRIEIAHDTVCFQPGLVGISGATIFEPWQCVPVDWADDDEGLR